MSERGYALPVKYMRSLALAIARQRSSAFQAVAIDDAIRPPGKNWPQPHYLTVIPENVHNMDNTGVLLSVLSSLKVLVGKQDLIKCRVGLLTTVRHSARIEEVDVGWKHMSKPPGSDKAKWLE
jgi:hypothetical protein